jgi:type VI secretion system secreted protein Hcp
MTIHMYLKLDDVKGEATADGFKDQIEILSWTWGLTQAGSAHHGSGTGTAGVTVGDVSLVKYVDKSTPPLIKLCCSGKFWTNALLTVCKAGTTTTPYLTLELISGIVTSVNSGGVGPEERLIETISLNFKVFKMNYKPQDQGKASGGIPAGWDIPGNKPA